MWRGAPEEDPRCAQRHAEDVVRFPQQVVLIRVGTDALVLLARIDVRHPLVEVVLLGHLVNFMDPFKRSLERFNFVGLEQAVLRRSLVVILAHTRSRCHLDRAVPQPL